MDKEDFKYCPKCQTNHSILMFDDCNIVECQNLNCSAIFRKKEYLKFLEFWDNLNHTLDEDFDRLVEHSKKLGFDMPTRSELFHIDAVGYSLYSKDGIYQRIYSPSELKDTEGEIPESWTEKKGNNEIIWDKELPNKLTKEMKKEKFKERKKKITKILKSKITAKKP